MRKTTFLHPLKWWSPADKFYELGSLNKEIEKVRELLDSFGRGAYEEYLKYLKKKHPEVIERFERSKKSSLLEFIK